MNQHRGRADAADTSSRGTLVARRPAVTDMTAHIIVAAAERAGAALLVASRQTKGCST
jgi:hypothetical protein